MKLKAVEATSPQGEKASQQIRQALSVSLLFLTKQGLDQFVGGLRKLYNCAAGALLQRGFKETVADLLCILTIG